MAGRVRYSYDSGKPINVIVEQLAITKFWDGTGFVGAPAVLAATEGTPRGRFVLDIPTPTATWPDGQYAVYVVITDKASGAIISTDPRFDVRSFTLVNGDDKPVAPVTISAPGATIKTG